MNEVYKLFSGRGGKSAGEVRTPYEAKNTLQSRAYVRFIDVLSEGPIEGFCDTNGLTVVDAKLYSDCQPSVKNGQLWYDPLKFDVEPETSGNAVPFFVYGKVDVDNPLYNTPLFTDSIGYPFSGKDGQNIVVTISATFQEPPESSESNPLPPTSTQTVSVKENAQVYLITYPRTIEEQTLTQRSYTQTSHGFQVNDIIARVRTAPNTYIWRKLESTESYLTFHTRIVTVVGDLNTFTSVVYPIFAEGRARGFYFKTVGQSYLTADPVQNPIYQLHHGFQVGFLIDKFQSVELSMYWKRVDRYSQTSAVVTKVDSPNSFEAYRQVFDPPKLNTPSVVATAIFFDDTPLADAVTLKYNFANVRLDYRLGDEIQAPMLGFEQTESLLSTEISPPITHLVADLNKPSIVKTLPAGDWDELVINLVLPDGLYRHDLTNGDILALGDNYSLEGNASAAVTDPMSQPPVIRITYNIETTVSGASKSSEEYPFGSNDGYVVIRGKTMSVYEVSIRGALLAPNYTGVDSHHYRLNFYRITQDDEEYTYGTVARHSKVVVGNITGLINARLTYPFCAMVGIEIDAEQFSSIPTRGYQVKLLKVEVPTNYFAPHTKRERTINGIRQIDFRPFAEYNRTPDGVAIYDETGNPVEQIWDGTFYESWTNNPAWVVYALATNQRFGFGNHIQQANKWLFYQVCRYCDQLIDTGWDGSVFTRKEPRFACACYFQTIDEAWKVLSDISSSFAGYLFYQGGSLIPIQDSPRKSRFVFGPANVENGMFSYAGINKLGRYSSVVVQYTEPGDRFKLATVVEQDAAMVTKLGWKPLERTAFGCTSKFQAQRFARRLLLTSNRLTTTVRFTTGVLGSVLRPGDVIEVYDPSRSSLPFAGRINDLLKNAETGSDAVVLDRFITKEELAATDTELFETYRVICQRPLGVPTAEEINSPELLLQYMEQQITAPLRISSIAQATNGNTVLYLADPLPPEVQVGYVWGLKRADVHPQTFQVVSVIESSKHKFDIDAIEYQEALYNAVDYDAAYDEPPINPDLDAWKRPYPPRNLMIHVLARINEDGQKIYVITLSWSPPEKGFARAYRVEWKRGLGDYQLLTTTHLTTAETIVVEADSYCAQVRTVGINNMLSTPIEVCQLIGVISADNKEIISGLEIQGQANDMIFTTADVSFDWRVNWSEADATFHTAVPPILPPNIADYEVTIYDLAMNPVYVTSRTDTSYLLTADQNRKLRSGPFREFILAVRARTRNGMLSRQTAIRVKNEKPPVPIFDFTIDNNANLTISFVPQTYPDFDHFNVWMSESVDFDPSDETLVYSGQSTVVSLAIEVAKKTYFRVAAMDQLAKNSLDCNISIQYEVVGSRVAALSVFDFLNSGWNG